ncbi:hypothetical protein HWX16_19505 [Ochrobactrum intermedium]|uniref:hypothetical protein n=1 Tax=Brucella intermedia TaxID=94625 RepID=UPI00159CA583|nr:hypothetical protein [Brucella intermedia]NVM42506.1 hypothetical protein [Brucella intermedia]
MQMPDAVTDHMIFGVGRSLQHGELESPAESLLKQLKSSKTIKNTFYDFLSCIQVTTHLYRHHHSNRTEFELYHTDFVRYMLGEIGCAGIGDYLLNMATRAWYE